MKFSKDLIDSMKVSAWMIGIMWVVHLFQVITTIDLGFLGIYPRQTWGLRGVITAPLIHADFHHLISNSVPLFVLTTTIFLFYRKVALSSYLMIYLLTGFTVWLFARNVFHIGASGVVYGLVSFVFWSGIFRRSLKAIVLALIVTVLYSGYFAGILPTQEGISWESHLIGGLVGIFVAYFYRDEIEKDEQKELASWEKEGDKETSFFLERDTFDKTKEERRQEKELRERPDWYNSPIFRENEDLKKEG